MTLCQDRLKGQDASLLVVFSFLMPKKDEMKLNGQIYRLWTQASGSDSKSLNALISGPNAAAPQGRLYLPPL